MTKTTRTITILKRVMNGRPEQRRHRWFPSLGTLALATALIVALSLQIVSPPGRNVLVGPGGARLHIQRTSDDLGSFTPYIPGELWGGGSTVEECLPCDLEAASGKQAGQSIQAGQQVNPATGDFTYSLPLFSVPATGGMSLGLDLQYDSQEAEYLIGCAFGGCHGPTALWPDFGVGWAASQFPTEGTWTDGSGTTWIEVVEPNGSLVTFQAIGSSTTCPQGDYSNYENYSVPSDAYGEGTNQQNFCAPYRVNAQIGQFASTYTVLDSQDGKSTYTFDDDYGTPTEGGNVANQGILTYNTTLESPGTSTCPTTADTGGVTGCWYIADATRTLTVVVGTPTDSTGDGNEAVLQVIDPQASQDYDITWYPSDFEEPSSVLESAESYVGASFGYQGGDTPGFDNMTEVQSATPGSFGELINYGGEDQGVLPEWVTSTTDQEEANTTSYSYLNASTCNPCLGSGQSETTTITYPDGEQDVDSYTEGILESNQYGTGSNQETVTYGINYPPYPSEQDNPITETFTGPASGQTTTASTNGINITLLEDSEGNYFTSTYDPVSDSDPASTFDELCWTAPGNESSDSCSDPPSGAIAYDYDTYGDVTSAADPYGNTTRYGYNDDLMICWVAPPTVTASGSSCGVPTAAPTEAPTGATAYQYDDQGDLNCQFVDYADSDEDTTRADYDTDGNMTDYYPPDAFGIGSYNCGATVPHPDYETTYVYTNGQLTKTTAPNSQVTTYTYVGPWLEKTKDPTGITTSAYDGDGRVCWTARASLTASVGSTPYLCSNSGVGSETSYTYLADTSTQATVTDPAEHTTTYSYANTAYPTSPTKIADPMDASITYDNYDANGNLCDSGTVATSSCLSQTGDTYYTYDGLDEDVASMQDPSGNTTTYAYTDSAFPNLVTSQTDALGTNTWTYKYDDDGRLYQSIDPSGNTITTGYDADSRKCWQEIGNVTTYTCGNGTLMSGIGDSIWDYNPDGTVSVMVDNVGTSEQTGTWYDYDAAGNPTLIIDDNDNPVSYAYNVSGQVTCIGYPGTSEIDADCSAAGSASNPIVKYKYDSENRLSSTTDWLGNKTKYTYSSDGLNNLTSISYPTTSADTVTYGYDTDSQVNSQTYGGSDLSGVPDQSWDYNSDGLVDSATQLDASGGTISNYTSSPTYDSSQDRDWVASNTNPDSSGADDYTYNLNGEVASDTPPSGSATSYGYNADAELCWSISGTSSNGCLSPPSGATTYTSTADGQRCWSKLASISSASCSSPPSSGATGYAWNAYGELCWSGPITSSPSCGSPPSGVTKYTYNGDGDRMTETSSSGSTEDFTWDTTGSTPLLLQDGTNAYIYGPELFGGTAPVEQINLTTGVAKYLTSAPSGVQLVLNQSGTIDNESSYSTYGKQSNSASAATPFGFSGAYTDPTGLVYLIHRYFDPSTGQFISVDPEVAASVQPYAYAGDDPVNGSDPNGLFETCGSNCGPDSGDIRGATGAIGCSENCGTQISPAQSFLSWLGQQSPTTIAFYDCAAAHGVQACTNFFSGTGSGSGSDSDGGGSGGTGSGDGSPASGIIGLFDTGLGDIDDVLQGLEAAGGPGEPAVIGVAAPAMDTVSDVEQGDSLGLALSKAIGAGVGGGYGASTGAAACIPEEAASDGTLTVVCAIGVVGLSKVGSMAGEYVGGTLYDLGDQGYHLLTG